MRSVSLASTPLAVVWMGFSSRLGGCALRSSPVYL